MSRSVRLALAQYPIERHATEEAALTKVERWIGEAVAAGAELLVLPEYAQLELASPQAPFTDGRAELAAAAALSDRWWSALASLARRHAVHVVGGSAPEFVGGELRNRCRVVGADGSVLVQDKLLLTRFESEAGLGGGAGVTVHTLSSGVRFATLVCYDSEQPLFARAALEAGAELLIVPSTTDTAAGVSRVRIGCQARALEQQWAVALAVTVGDAPWSQCLDHNHGRAGVFVPPDRGMPDDGVLVLGDADVPGWVYATVDLDRIDSVREHGQVRNRLDFGVQTQRLQAR